MEPRNQFERRIADGAKRGVTQRTKKTKGNSREIRSALINGLTTSQTMRDTVMADDQVIEFEKKHMSEDTEMTVKDWKEYGTLLSATVNKHIERLQSVTDDGTSRVATDR